MNFGADIFTGLGSVLGGVFAGRGRPPSETKMQKTQRNLVDQLLSSLNGKGAYSDLFNSSEENFHRSFVEPAMSRFRNQIAPQIQQQYIQSGQQRGTGLDDQLLRAGVDLNSMLDQYAYQNQQDVSNRKQNVIGNILGAGSGAQNDPTVGQDVMSSLGGYLSSAGFANSAGNLFKSTAPPTYQNYQSPRRGYENDYQYGGSR